MTARALIGLGVVLWVGTTLVLSDVRWFRKRRLAARVGPFIAPSRRAEPGPGPQLRPLDAAREVLGPLAADMGARAARLTGTRDELERRLERLGRDAAPADFRFRQLMVAAGALMISLTIVALISPAPVVSISIVLGIPVFAVLMIEQRLIHASDQWQQQLERELPVITEQLGMLLTAGYSLGGALARIAERSSGLTADGLRRVGERVRQGMTEVQALTEFAELADVHAMDRLVRVLAMNSVSSDLGDLISAEGRLARDEAHQHLLEVIERRSQQVWIPVTVATLVPGVIFMAVPFVDAMRKLTGG